ncbi:MAG: hypothetical protein U9O98_04160 [Asgard group archaeon]|nr:hypothetical protein [Asgard group archaeon]
MAIKTRSKYFWSRFIATSVKYLGIANTQQIRFIAEQLLPTELSRQNILYHVRTAEQKGWIVTFASSMSYCDKNDFLFRKKFMEKTDDKISSQRFIIFGTEYFEPVSQEEIIKICKKFDLEPISIIDRETLSLVTNYALKRLNSVKEKAKGNAYLFMLLLRFGWLWLSINPKKSLKIIDVIKEDKAKHNYNTFYKIDVKLLEIASKIEIDTLPNIDSDDINLLLNRCLKLASSSKRKDILNLMSIVLIIIGRYLVSINQLSLAKEFLDKGIKFLRMHKRKSILMRKLHVDGLFDLAYINYQLGWFYQALDVYENIERILNEEFTEEEPSENLFGKLSLAKAELYLMISWPAYVFEDRDYKKLLNKAFRASRDAYKYYKETKNQQKQTEINLLSSWICALNGKIWRANSFYKRGTKTLDPPLTPRINIFLNNAKAEIHRKKGEFLEAIRAISSSIDYLKIVGNVIAKLFCMTRIVSLHIAITGHEDHTSFISYGDMSSLFEHGRSDMISHVFLEYNKKLLENPAIIQFYAHEKLVANHPELTDYVDFIDEQNISPELLDESFTIIPSTYIDIKQLEKRKVNCLVGDKPLVKNDAPFASKNYQALLDSFDSLFLKIMTDK